ncbi:MAG TPA: BamA/TamA family outer membrane protein [Bacteroidia bacterium]|jgi:outer membrane protein assembly factor BamA|nr:BamA/TamA family outer membrane protein [Bacteroidia bacterium]
MGKILILFYFSLLSFSLQATLTDTSKHSSEKKVQVKLIPVISYAPETGFLFGVGALAAFQMCKEDSITHHSLVEAFVAYTQKNQDYLYIPYILYTKNNKYYFEGELDYYNYSYYYWGIGTNRVPKELYNVRFPKLFVNAFRKVLPHFYAGIDYYYENDDIWQTASDGVLKTGEVLGSKGSINSGAGIDLLYDTRDSIYFPRKGWFIKVLSYANSPTLGSTFTYNKIQSDISCYNTLSDRLVLGLNEHTQLTWGDVPFNQLALVGGTKQIRGYYTGYYRDDDLTFLQAEFRYHLKGRVSLVAFGSAALLGNAQVFPEKPVPICAEGVGIRYNYNVKRHINVRGDIGYGTTVEYYLTVQEAF